MDATPTVQRQIEIPYLGHYYLKTFEMAKDKKVGAAKSSSPGLWLRLPAASDCGGVPFIGLLSTVIPLVILQIEYPYM